VSEERRKKDGCVGESKSEKFLRRAAELDFCGAGRRKQRLKPGDALAHLSASLKRCPDTNHVFNPIRIAPLGRINSSPLGVGREPVVAFGVGDSILANLVQKRFVADLQHGCGLFAIPVRLFQGLHDGFSFGFVFGVAG